MLEHKHNVIDAGFFLPFSASERWYRAQLESTGIIYAMVLGGPQIPNRGQYPANHFDEYARRDRKILESFRTEYEARLAAEELSVKAILDSPEVIVAHVVYSTGCGVNRRDYCAAQLLVGRRKDCHAQSRIIKVVTGP